MTDFPKGGDFEVTRNWLDKEGFQGYFNGWKADALLGKTDAFIKKKFPRTGKGQDEAKSK